VSGNLFEISHWTFQSEEKKQTEKHHLHVALWWLAIFLAWLFNCRNLDKSGNEITNWDWYCIKEW